jgi:hypothetical protein
MHIMSNSLRLALLFGLLGFSSQARAQQPYDSDDEDELARQQYAADQQQQVQPDVPQYGYVGVHPIPYDQGSGFCYIQGAHFHPYAPFDQYLFRESNGYFYFIGDPGDFGYAQQTYGYNGNHPIPLEYGGGYCYISWGHRHHYPPPNNLTYNFVGGYYVYAGPWDPLYWTWRDRYVGYYGGYYRSNYYGGRYYTVRPPPVYRPSLVIGAPGVYRPGVTVRAPGGRVTVGVPGGRVGVTVGAPGGRVYAPAPAPRVYAPAPAPRVYAPAPAPRVYAPAPRVNVAPPAPVRRPAPVVVPAPRRR